MALHDQSFHAHGIKSLPKFAHGLARAFQGILAPGTARTSSVMATACLTVLLIAGASLGSAPQFGRSGTNGQGPGESRQQQQQPQPIPSPDNGVSPSLSPRQKLDLLRSNFERMKKDTDVLLDLAKSLQKDLDGSNQNVLSLKVVDKAEKIEKLAKKIKNSARGY